MFRLSGSEGRPEPVDRGVVTFTAFDPYAGGSTGTLLLGAPTAKPITFTSYPWGKCPFLGGGLVIPFGAAPGGGGLNHWLFPRFRGLDFAAQAMYVHTYRNYRSTSHVWRIRT